MMSDLTPNTDGAQHALQHHVSASGKEFQFETLAESEDFLLRRVTITIHLSDSASKSFLVPESVLKDKNRRWVGSYVQVVDKRATTPSR